MSPSNRARPLEHKAASSEDNVSKRLRTNETPTSVTVVPSPFGQRPAAPATPVPPASPIRRQAPTSTHNTPSIFSNEDSRNDRVRAQALTILDPHNTYTPSTDESLTLQQRALELLHDPSVSLFKMYPGEHGAFAVSSKDDILVIKFNVDAAEHQNTYLIEEFGLTPPASQLIELKTEEPADTLIRSINKNILVQEFVSGETITDISSGKANSAGHVYQRREKTNLVRSVLHDIGKQYFVDFLIGNTDRVIGIGHVNCGNMMIVQDASTHPKKVTFTPIDNTTIYEKLSLVAPKFETILDELDNNNFNCFNTLLYNIEEKLLKSEPAGTRPEPFFRYFVDSFRKQKDNPEFWKPIQEALDRGEMPDEELYESLTEESPEPFARKVKIEFEKVVKYAQENERTTEQTLKDIRSLFSFDLLESETSYVPVCFSQEDIEKVYAGFQEARHEFSDKKETLRELIECPRVKENFDAISHTLEAKHA